MKVECTIHGYIDGMRNKKGKLVCTQCEARRMKEKPEKSEKKKEPSRWDFLEGHSEADQIKMLKQYIMKMEESAKREKEKRAFADQLRDAADPFRQQVREQDRTNKIIEAVTEKLFNKK